MVYIKKSIYQNMIEHLGKPWVLKVFFLCKVINKLVFKILVFITPINIKSLMYTIFLQKYYHMIC